MINREYLPLLDEEDINDLLLGQSQALAPDGRGLNLYFIPCGEEGAHGIHTIYSHGRVRMIGTANSYEMATNACRALAEVKRL